MNNYVGETTKFAGALLKPLADAGVKIFFLRGNHDEYVKHADITALIAEYAGGVNCSNELLLRIRVVDKYVKGKTFVVYAAHGAGGGAKPGAKINRARDSVFVADADAYLYGHVHDAIHRIEQVPTLSTHGKPTLRFKERLYSYAASFVASRQQNVFDYPNAKSLAAVNHGKYAFLVDTMEDKVFDARIL